MVLTVKERREAGRKRELEEMTVAKRVLRQLTNGRPPASELRTPVAAVSAARTLHRDIQKRIEEATNGTRTRAREYFAVTVAYVTPDLSALGFTSLYEEAGQDRMERMLTGNIPIGLLFGIADGKEILVGARPFIVTKQTDDWLKELAIAAHSELEIDRAER
jgi:hypothetical protein